MQFTKKLIYKGYEWDLPTMELKNEQNAFAPLPPAEFFLRLNILAEKSNSFSYHLCQVTYFWICIRISSMIIPTMFISSFPNMLKE